MVTKTQPKPASSPYMHKVIFTSEQREEILDALNLEDSKKELQNHVILALEGQIFYHFNLLARLPSRSKPAHVKAELEDIAALANKLAARILNSSVSTSVLLHHVETAELWYPLSMLAVEAEMKSKAFKAESSDGGATNKEFKHVLSNVEKMLENFFKTRRQDGEGDEKEGKKLFLEICMGVLPRMPGRRQKRPKSQEN